MMSFMLILIVLSKFVSNIFEDIHQITAQKNMYTYIDVQVIF